MLVDGAAVAVAKRADVDRMVEVVNFILNLVVGLLGAKIYEDVASIGVQGVSEGFSVIVRSEN